MNLLEKTTQGAQRGGARWQALAEERMDSSGVSRRSTRSVALTLRRDTTGPTLRGIACGNDRPNLKWLAELLQVATHCLPLTRPPVPSHEDLTDRWVEGSTVQLYDIFQGAGPLSIRLLSYSYSWISSSFRIPLFRHDQKSSSILVLSIKNSKYQSRISTWAFAEHYRIRFRISMKREMEIQKRSLGPPHPIRKDLVALSDASGREASDRRQGRAGARAFAAPPLPTPPSSVTSPAAANSWASSPRPGALGGRGLSSRITFLTLIRSEGRYTLQYYYRQDR
ncbi:Protein of unknown function [Gryllus bimaculatus]|nr:Protein of unknown function [Gryllus bimaculatus]